MGITRNQNITYNQNITPVNMTNNINFQHKAWLSGHLIKEKKQN